MRQVVLDTETTGLDPTQHKLIEIGCVELINRIPGRTYHTYINPQRKVDYGAFKVHGLDNDFLDDKPLFNDIAFEFIEFIQGAELIIHNAPFDVGFLNRELKFASTRIDLMCSVLDSLVLAKSKVQGKCNLDALAKKFKVKAKRDLHGALLDAKILSEVYLAMTSNQNELDLFVHQDAVVKQEVIGNDLTIIYPSEEEMALHTEYMKIVESKQVPERKDYH